MQLDHINRRFIRFAIPDDPDLLAQILFLYEISGGSDFYNRAGEDFSSSPWRSAASGRP
ncbi:MAG: hypothetical protein LBU16_00875 [Treponema sp.]|jgi:hypothetical protein|nr:hypothetical protein [Treponema sp.]